MKLIQNSYFTVQGMFFFNNFILVQLYYTYIWKSYAYISYHPAIISPRIFSNISVMKKLHYNFANMGGGVEGRLEFFQKIIRFGSATLP